MTKETLETLTPEERHRIYEVLGLNVYERPDWSLEIRGVFANTAEEVEAGLSSCKPSPRSFAGDELPTLRFRALLTEGGAERLELTRA